MLLMNRFNDDFVEKVTHAVMGASGSTKGSKKFVPPIMGQSKQQGGLANCQNNQKKSEDEDKYPVRVL